MNSKANRSIVGSSQGGKNMSRDASHVREQWERPHKSPQERRSHIDQSKVKGLPAHKRATEWILSDKLGMGFKTGPSRPRRATISEGAGVEHEYRKELRQE